MIEDEEIRFLCSEEAIIPMISDRKYFAIHEPFIVFISFHDDPFNYDFDPFLTNKKIAIFGMALDVKEALGVDIEISQNDA